MNVAEAVRRGWYWNLITLPFAATVGVAVVEVVVVDVVVVAVVAVGGGGGGSSMSNHDRVWLTNAPTKATSSVEACLPQADGWSWFVGVISPVAQTLYP